MVPPNKHFRYFKAEKLMLKLSGIKVEGLEGFFYKIYKYIALIIFNGGFTILLFVDALHQDFDEAIDNWFLVCGTGWTLSVTIVIYKNRLKLGKLLNKLEKVPFLPNFERGGENEENMLQKFSKHVKIQGGLLFLGLTFSMFSQMVYTLYVRIVSSNSEDWIMGFIHITLVNVTYSPNYEILWVYQNVSIIFLIFLASANTLLIAGLTAFVSTQFQMLQNNLKRLFYNTRKQLQQNNSKDSRLSLINPHSLSWKYLRHSIKEVVKYHLNILEIFQETDDIFSYSIFSLFIVTLALLCIEVYRASMLPISDMRTLRLFLEYLTCCFHSMMICYSGEQMAYESVKVADAAFEINFIGTDPRFQKSLSMIIQRSQRPARIKAGKIIDAALVTLVWILRTSYSAYMMLKKIKSNA